MIVSRGEIFVLSKAQALESDQLIVKNLLYSDMFCCRVRDNHGEVESAVSSAESSYHRTNNLL